MNIAASIVAAALAFTVGTVTGSAPSSATDGAQCQVVSSATTVEQSHLHAGRRGRLFPVERDVTSTTTRCGSDYSTTITFSDWRRVIKVPSSCPAYTRCAH